MAATTMWAERVVTLPFAQARRLALTAGPAAISTTAMLFVGGYHLGRPTLGWDELATLSAAARPLPAIARLATHIDGVLTPYYSVMHFWTKAFGTSEATLRLPSLLAVAAGVGIAAELGRRLFGWFAGLLTGLILVMIPSLTFYAQEARPYGFAFCFATLSTLLCYRARWWPLYAAALALAGLSHMLTLLIVFGHAVIVFNRGRRLLIPWLIAVAVAVLPVLPFVWLGLRQRDTQLSWMPAPSWSSVPTAPGQVLGAYLAGGGGAAVITAMAFLLIGMALLIRGRGVGVVVELGTLAVVPAAILLGVSLVAAPIWMPRYALSSVVPLVLLAAGALAGPPPVAVSRALPRVAIAVVLLAVLAYPAQKVVRTTGAHVGGDYRAMARVLTALARPGDAILYGEGSAWALRGAVEYYVPPSARPSDVLLRTPAVSRDALSATERPAQNALGSTQFVWYIKSTRYGDPVTSTNPRLHDRRLDELRRRYRPVSTWHSDTLWMSRWELASP
jgi:mannosyltransferase